ncbi:hypothetical protein SAMN05421747_12911 [Parapedobacter composti]|uniref:Uncharacterized protein n=1 Tax=Parapedobacter composti TaxID=623281 RepID=A0A1I1M6Y9_9SPHI|nr:hypothetical protein SAMN05421747_12911 [Parapedobacter composti]
MAWSTLSLTLCELMLRERLELSLCSVSIYTQLNTDRTITLQTPRMLGKVTGYWL